MSQWPLNWRDLVEEAARRRKAENLSQAALAAIAGVSRATVLALERGDTNLQLGKAFDILGALNLLKGVGPVDSQDTFVQAARNRWQDLVATLPQNDPARLPLGHVSYDYQIEGVGPVPLRDLPAILRSLEGYTGWPPFWIATRSDLRPYNREGQLECWFGGGRDRLLTDAGHSDFWRVAPDGRAFLRRGYQEDGPDNLQPGAIFDLTLPIWRTAELLLHSAQLARAVGGGGDTVLRLRCAYTGLEGRELASWAKPLLRHQVPGGLRARSSSATSTEVTSVAEVEEDLEGLTARLVRPVYERFEGYQPPDALIADEIAELRRTGERRRRSERG
jgi:transcriptional regulator with XRE-family HTH domain